MPPYAPGNPEWVDGRSILFHDTVTDIAGATITATGTAANDGTQTFDIANAVDGLTYDYWKGSGFGTTITITLPQSAPVDYVAFAAHTMFSKQGAGALQGSNDGTNFTTIFASIAPVSDAPFVLIAPAPVAFKIYRFQFGFNLSGPQIGILMLGMSTPLQRGVRVGHRPAPFQRQVEYTTNQAEAGQFLGRSIQRVSNEIAIVLSNITDRWYREKFEPFALKAETKPFFFMWDKWRRPDEVFFGYTTQRPKPTNDQTTFMSVSIDAVGIA